MRPWQLASRNPSALPYPETLSTILNNGQSNAEAQPGVPGTPGPMTALLGPDLLVWSDIEDRFIEAGDGGGNFRAYRASDDQLAPCAGQILTQLMRLIATASGRSVYGISHARSSHEIAYFEENSAQLSQYGDNTTHPTLNNFQHIRQAVQRSGRRIGLMLWCQGESDGIAGDSQAVYYAKIAPLFAAYWATYRAPIVLIKTISTAPGVRAAQQQLADERDYVHMLDNSDMIGNATYFDGLHYTSGAGYFKVADRVFAMLRREELPGL